MTTFQIQTRSRSELVDITDHVRAAVRESRAGQGICVVYCPHTTAAITVNENADPDVAHDILLHLDRTVAQRQAGFRHGEGNSDSHIKAGLIGPSVTLIVDKQDLVLGRWQGVFFCEFDGPRARSVHVKILGESRRN